MLTPEWENSYGKNKKKRADCFNLLNFAAGSSPVTLTDALVSQFISEAINRLIVKQRNIDTSDRVLRVNQVKTRLVQLTTIVFFVEVLFESGEVASVVDQVKVRPVALNHLAQPDALLTI